MKPINPIKFKRTMILNGLNSYKFNDAGDSCPISRFTMFAHANNEWYRISEKTVMEEPVCVMFNKKKADACSRIHGEKLVHYDKVFLIWQEGTEHKRAEGDEIKVWQEPWNGLVFYNTPEREKILKWVDTGFCSEEMSQLVLFVMSMVFGEQELVQNKELQRFRIGVFEE